MVERLQGWSRFGSTFFLSAWITLNLGKQTDRAKSVLKDEVSTKMRCPQGEVLLYIQGIQ